MRDTRPTPTLSAASPTRLLAVLALAAAAASPAHAQAQVGTPAVSDSAAFPPVRARQQASPATACENSTTPAACVRRQLAPIEPVPRGWSGDLWLGPRLAPDYQGSRTSHASVLPGLALHYGTEDAGSFAIGPRGLAWDFLERPDATLGIGLQLDPGRSDHHGTGLRPGSDRLFGMGSIAAAPLLVLEGTSDLAGLPLAFELKRAAASEHGTQLDLSIPLRGRIGAGLLAWRLAPGLELADRRYQQAFFGVDAAQATATGRPRFEPHAGPKSAELEGGLDLALGGHWGVGVSVQYERLLGDAARSPVVERKDQLGGELHAGYRF